MKPKSILILVAFLGLTVFLYLNFRSKSSDHTEGSPSGPSVQKRHSDSLNQSVNMLMEDYFKLSNCFVNADTTSIKQSAIQMKKNWQVINSNWFEKDTILTRSLLIDLSTNVQSNLESLIQQTDITEMRRDFSSLTEAIFPAFFNAVHYEGSKIYVQRCPMAFNDTEPASWISPSAEIMNPYLGKKHPVYQAGMLHCGEVVDSIQIKP
jgi:hypothetical protein